MLDERKNEDNEENMAGESKKLYGALNQTKGTPNTKPKCSHPDPCSKVHKNTL